jgi:hypothetical protein
VRRASIALGLTCLALAGGACAGDDEDSSASSTAGEQTESPSADRPTATAPDNNRTPGDEGGGSPADEQDESADPVQPSESKPQTERPPRTKRRAERDRRRVRATLAAFLNAMGDRDARRACARYTREVRMLVGGTLGGSCASGMEFAFLVIGRDRRSFRRVRVREVDVSGGRASIRLRLPPALRNQPMLDLLAPGARVALERQAGRWQLGLPSL